MVTVSEPIPSNLKRVRGVFRHGTCAERAGMLGTFLDTTGLDGCRYHIRADGTVFVSLSRSMWQSWRGELTAAQWESLSAWLPSEVCPESMA